MISQMIRTSAFSGRTEISVTTAMQSSMSAIHLNFTLNEVPFGERGALSHMGIQVGSTEDVFAVRERWYRDGLVTRDEMNTDCCYAVQDKTWVHDPDGNEWEVFVVKQDNLPEKASTADACCASTCCTTAEAVQA